MRISLLCLSVFAVVFLAASTPSFAEKEGLYEFIDFISFCSIPTVDEVEKKIRYDDTGSKPSDFWEIRESQVDAKAWWRPNFGVYSKINLKPHTLVAGLPHANLFSRHSVAAAYPDLKDKLDELQIDGKSKIALLLFLQRHFLASIDKISPYLDKLWTPYANNEDLGPMAFVEWDDIELNEIYSQGLLTETNFALAVVGESQAIVKTFEQIKEKLFLPNAELFSIHTKPKLLSLREWRIAHHLASSRVWTIGDELVFAPGLDFFNHHENPNARVQITDTHFIVLLDQEVQPGDEIFISYGAFTNAQIASNYGFVPSGNKDDVLVLQLTGSRPLVALAFPIDHMFMSNQKAEDGSLQYSFFARIVNDPEIPPTDLLTYSRIIAMRSVSAPLNITEERYLNLILTANATLPLMTETNPVLAKQLALRLKPFSEISILTIEHEFLAFNLALNSLRQHLSLFPTTFDVDAENLVAINKQLNELNEKGPNTSAYKTIYGLEKKALALKYTLEYKLLIVNKIYQLITMWNSILTSPITAAQRAAQQAAEKQKTADVEYTIGA